MQYVGKCQDRQGAIADLYTDGEKYFRANPGHKREDKKKFKTFWKKGKYIGKVNAWVVSYMVRNRWPVPEKAIPPDNVPMFSNSKESTRQWLASMGYGDKVKDRFGDIHWVTCENKNHVRTKSSVDIMCDYKVKYRKTTGDNVFKKKPVKKSLELTPISAPKITHPLISSPMISSPKLIADQVVAARAYDKGIRDAKASGASRPEFDYQKAAAEIKAKGADRQGSFTDMIRMRHSQTGVLGPGIDAKEWFPIYDAAPGPAANPPEKDDPMMALALKSMREGLWRAWCRIVWGLPGLPGSGTIHDTQFQGGLAGVQTAWVLGKPGFMMWWDAMPIVGFYCFGALWPQVMGEIMKDSPGKGKEIYVKLFDEFGYPNDVFNQMTLEQKHEASPVGIRLVEMLAKYKNKGKDPDKFPDSPKGFLV